MKNPSLAKAKQKLAAAKKAKPENKREWGRIIRGAESLLKSAGVKS
ncbi:hypothetical protein ABCW43_00160 [Neorhizobium sp. IRAMC:178]